MYPLQQRRGQRRAAHAWPRSEALAAAQADYARANGTLTGKDRALKELDDVLQQRPRPGSDRRPTPHLRTPGAAGRKVATRLRAPQVRAGRRARKQPDAVEGHDGCSPGATRISATSFTTIETSPEFVVIDDVGLTESVQNGDSVRLTLQLSTYFRTTETTSHDDALSSAALASRRRGRRRSVLLPAVLRRRPSTADRRSPPVVEHRRRVRATRSEMCGSSRSTGRMTPGRRPAAMYSDSERSVRLLCRTTATNALECRSSLCHKRRPDRRRLRRFRSASSGISINPVTFHESRC